MSSKLGDLPGFGRTGSSRPSSGGSQLDSTLESLLGGASEEDRKPRGSRVTQRDQGRNNFYQQMAEDISDEEDVSISVHNTKQLVESLDVENLDANLFGSFNKKKKRSSSSSTSSNNPTSEGGTARPTSRGGGKGGGLGGVPQSSRQIASSGAVSKKTVPAPSSTTFDMNRDEDLDDILDLLSADDDGIKKPADKNTPRKHSTTEEGKAEPGKFPEGNPITYEQNTPEIDRMSARDTDPVSTHTPLKLGQAASRASSTPVRQTQPSPAAPKPNQINFDDDDDDLLSGLGLDDSRGNTSNNTQPSSNSAPKNQGAVTTATPKHQQGVLGTATPGLQGAVDNNNPTAPRSTLTASPVSNLDASESENEDSFQFGGYVPTFAAKSALGRRRATDTPTHTSSSSAAKKTVRFSDQLETSDIRRVSAPVETKESGKRGGEPQTAPQRGSETFKPSSAESERASPSTPASPPGTSILDDDLVDFLDDSQPTSVKTQEAGRRSEAEDEDEGEEVKLEHPVFPWQRSSPSVKAAAKRPSSGGSNIAESAKRPSSGGSQIAESATRPSSGSAKVSELVPRQLSGSISTAESAESLSNVATRRGRPTVTLLDTAEVGRDRGGPRDSEKEASRAELKVALERAQAVEAALEREKAEHAQTKDLLSSKVKEGAEKLENLEQELTSHRNKVSELEETKRKTETELKEKYEECKVQLFKMQLERDQLQQLLETSKHRQQEEIDSLQKSLNLRLTSTEESYTRRESRWKEELESEVARGREKLEQAEREKTDALLALRRKLDALEVSRTNEISRLQGVHRSSVDDLKREHEADRQHLIMLHQQELEAVKAAHSHTRMLSELNSKVEASAKEVSQLQAKLSEAHGKLVEDRVQRNKMQENHLKTLEERLISQQAENEAERERLQNLVSKLEAHIAQQSRSVEQERWQIQQETTRLKAQQAAFQQERASSLSRLEEQRKEFQTTRERFLTEQQEILAKCYEEQRTIAGERAQVALLRKKAEEREGRDKANAAKLSEESAQLLAEKESLTHLQQALREERTSLDSDRERVEAFAREIQKRSEEIDTLCKSSVEARERGEQELLEAQRLKEEALQQSTSLHSQMAELREKEQRVAAESLSLAERRRTLEQEILTSSHQTNSLSLSLHPPPPPSFDTTRRITTPDLPSASLSSTHPLQLKPPRSHTVWSSASAFRPLTADTAAPQQHRGYSPRTSPAHRMMVGGPDLAGESNSRFVQLYLAEVERKKNMRQIATDAEKDYEALQKESEFLASLETSKT